jgi:hypothetical protein
MVPPISTGWPAQGEHEQQHNCKISLVPTYIHSAVHKRAYPDPAKPRLSEQDMEKMTIKGPDGTLH